MKNSESLTMQNSSDTETPQEMPKVSKARIETSPERGSPEAGTVAKVAVKKGILKAPSIDKYSLKCTVNLFRDDLKKIQDVFIKKAEGTISPENFSPLGFQCNINEKLSPNNYVPDTSKSKKTVSFSKTVTVIELVGYSRCKKCPRVFYTRKALKSHIKKMHKKKQAFICCFCEKQFMDRMFLKVHMKLHCDVCGLLLPSRAKCLEHKRTICRTLHKCPNCECTCFRQKDLRDHSYDHIDPCFVCDICKDKFNSKCATAHHIRFLHSKNRPKAMYNVEKVGVEQLFLCNFCDVSNIDKNLIEEHQIMLPDLTNRIMKGTKDYFFCDRCKKKFKKEKKLLDHKCSHLLNTNDKSHMSPKAKKDNAPDNLDTRFESLRKNYVTHNVMLNDAQDYSNDSLATEKSVSPLNFEKENIESNNNCNPKDTHNFSLIDLLNSKSTPPPFLSKCQNTPDIQKFYKIEEVPQIMFKPKVVLNRCKINGEDVTKKLTIIDLKRHNVSEGKVMNISATNDMDMIVAKTSATNDVDMIVTKTSATNDVDMVTKTSATNDVDMIVTKTSATNDVDMIVTKTSATNDVDMIVINTSATNDVDMIVTKTSATNDVDMIVTNTSVTNDEHEKVAKTPAIHGQGDKVVSATNYIKDTDKTTIDSNTPLLQTTIDQNNPPLKQVHSATSTTTSPVSNESDAQPSAEKRPRKTLFSKHQCTICGQYYSSGYCLRRHMSSQHHDLESLQCKVCEETFVWPTLLFSHKCIRLNHQEMPFQDARPEIHFDNVQSLNPEFDEMNIRENEGYDDNFETPVAEPMQGGVLNGSNETGKQSLLAQFLSQPCSQPKVFSQIPRIQPNGFSQIPHIQPNVFSQIPRIQPNVFSQIPRIQPNGFSQIPHIQPNVFSQIPRIQPNGFSQIHDSVDEFDHLPIVTNPNVISQVQRPFGHPLLQQLPQTNFVLNTFAEASNQGFMLQKNGLNRQVHTVTRLNQLKPNGMQENHFMNGMQQQSQFRPNGMQQNYQKTPVSSQNYNLNGSLTIAQLERMGYKIVMEEVPVEFQN